MIDDTVETTSTTDVVEATVKSKRGRVATPQKTTVRIILEESENIPPNGLYLGHNGRGFLIQTGQPVDIPVELLNILDNAVISTPQLDPVTKAIVGYRDRLHYPYRRLDSGT